MIGKKPKTDIRRQALIDCFKDVLHKSEVPGKLGPAYQTLLMEAIRFHCEHRPLNPSKSKEKDVPEGKEPRTLLKFKMVWELPGFGDKVELEVQMWEEKWNTLV